MPGLSALTLISGPGVGYGATAAAMTVGGAAFASAGGYASARLFSDGYVVAMGVWAALALMTVTGGSACCRQASKKLVRVNSTAPRRA